MNESTGVYSSTLGGRYNECSGDNSVTLGGSENKTYGTNSITMGVNTLCNHDNSFLFNSSEDDELMSTNDKQFMIGCDNGTIFKLPKSNEIQTHHIPEGFACWCWDPKLKTVIMKTKQDNEMYKTTVPTDTNQIKINLNPLKRNSGISLGLINPDLH